MDASVNLFKDTFLNTTKFHSFYDEMRKLDFIDCILDLEEYLNYWKMSRSDEENKTSIK